MGALANLAADDGCSGRIVAATGVPALVQLLRCDQENIQEQAARALANLAAHGDTSSHSVAMGQQDGCLHSLVTLLASPSETLRCVGLLYLIPSLSPSQRDAGHQTPPARA